MAYYLEEIHLEWTTGENRQLVKNSHLQKDNPYDKINNRPVSILPILSKVF